MNCPKCGSPLPEEPGADCPACHAPADPALGAAGEKPGQIEWEAPPPPPRSRAKTLALLGALAILAGWKSGTLTLDAFYDRLARGVTPPPPIAARPAPEAPRPAPVTAPARPGPPRERAWTKPPSQKLTVEAPAKAAEWWTFEGRLYDMLSLHPIFAAQLSFQAEGRKPMTAQTDEDGRYRIRLPALRGRGYRVLIRHPDYDGKQYFDEISPAYRTLDPEERGALARVIPIHRPWTGQTGKKTRRDLVLLPSRRAE